MEKKSAPNKFVKFITNKWFLHGLGLFILALLVWFVGPIIAISENYFLESVASRLLLILFIVFSWALYQFYQHYKRRKNDSQFAENLTVQNAKKDEAQTISDRFNEAINILQAKSGNKRDKNAQLNALPWYIIIGPPGSGKTTALLNSGLEFPLKDKLGADAIKGIGGTRHCDWWFTNEAVLIDTAGRFTTQDSDSEVDKTAWQSFMSMLKKHRKQRPINGALVTMSLSDMLTMPEDERTYYAKTIRKRIEELNDQLSIKFPVYFMFTKCDLVNGFIPFFDALSAKQRDQVWGETFDIDENGNCAIDIQQYHEHFDELIDRLNTQLLLNIKQQHDPAKKADIFSFPSQMDALKEPIHDFLVNIFGENKFQKTALLRGVYFTSGTQQGSPFDSLLGTMANDMGLQEETAVNYSGRGKSYFISDLLSQVIFPESEMAGVDQKLQRWMKRLRILSLVSASAVIIAMSIVWYTSYEINVDRIQRIDASIEQQNELIIQRSESTIDFMEILDELNAARAATTIFEPKEFSDNFGLNQRRSFDSQNQAIYLNVLETRLLPLVKTRLEEIMIDILRQGDHADLYTFLKAYLMYAGQHTIAGAELEPEWLKAIALADWQVSLLAEPEAVVQLNAHLDYLLSQPFAFIMPDENVVSSARLALLKLPLEEQVYAAIKDFMLSDKSGDLSFSDIAGNDAIDVFVTRDARLPSELYIPFMFTKKGFFSSFISTASDKADEYLNNTWILGEHNKQDDIPSPDELQDRIYTIYYRDYIGTWRQYLRNLEIADVSNQQQGFSILRTIGDQNSPLEKLLTTVSQETNLTQVSEEGEQAQALGEVASVVNARAQRVVSQANRVSRAANKADLVSLPGSEVTENFSEFHQLSSTERGDPKLLAISNGLNQYSSFIEQTLLDNFAETPAFNAVLDRMNNPARSEFSRLVMKDSTNPEALNRWLDEVSDIGWSMVVQDAKDNIEQIWQQQVYPIYSQALAGRYPFETQSMSEVELRDFANFFKPNGVFDEFVKQYIVPFVNTNTASWQLRSFGGQSLNFSPQVLSDMQTANRITQYFFTPNAAMPSLSFSMLPLSLDANVAQFSMNVGSQKLSYAHGPRRSSKITWPLVASDESTRIEFMQLDGRVKQATETGPWSLFKLLDKQRMSATPRNAVYNANISVEGLSVQYEIRADSEFNPLGAKILQNFTLPEEL
ncbi:type VI secretion system membrane subunit TssM [Ningiella sp. W23]|uniref:type VI secretion system membrane subunit TssM n=1 Tax=Ningiella sp. W23 TaxID=3023715 RepID=UPI0037568A40